MEKPSSRLGDQEQSLVAAIAFLEAGNAQEALSVLDQPILREEEHSPSGPSLVSSLGRSVHAHALADLGQGQQALASLVEALSLVDPESYLMEHVWPVGPMVRSGVAQRSMPLPVPRSFQELIDMLPLQASNPTLLCCKAEALYAFHEFEASGMLLACAFVLDAWRGHHTLPRASILNNYALALFKAGNGDMAVDLAATTAKGLEPGSSLAAPLFYNWAALLWERSRREEAASLYHQVLVCDASDGRSFLARARAAEKLGVPLPPGHAVEAERQRTTQAALYDTARFSTDEEPRIWIPIFAAWLSARASQLD